MEPKTPAPLQKRVLAWLLVPWLIGGTLFALTALYLAFAWAGGNLEQPFTFETIQRAATAGAATLAVTLLVAFAALMVWGSIERIKEIRKEHRGQMETLERYERRLNFAHEQAQTNREALLHAVTIMQNLAEEAAGRGARVPGLQVIEDELGDIRGLRRDPDPARRPARRISV